MLSQRTKLERIVRYSIKRNGIDVVTQRRALWFRVFCSRTRSPKIRKISKTSVQTEYNTVCTICLLNNVHKICMTFMMTIY
jgi:hypothetical protein